MEGIGVAELMLVVFMALTVEAIWETAKMIWQDGKVNVDKVAVIIIGLIVAFAKPLDLYELIGYGFSMAYVGKIFTGIMISRGANFIHDYLGKR